MRIYFNRIRTSFRPPSKGKLRCLKFIISMKLTAVLIFILSFLFLINSLVTKLIFIWIESWVFTFLTLVLFQFLGMRKSSISFILLSIDLYLRKECFTLNYLEILDWVLLPLTSYALHLDVSNFGSLKSANYLVIWYFPLQFLLGEDF